MVAPADSDDCPDTRCQGCGQRYKVDVMIPDALWKRIRFGRNLLCGVCIMRGIEKLDCGIEYLRVQVIPRKLLTT